MADVWLYTAAVFALANTVLIIILVVLYSSSFRKIRSPFTMGLILFAVFFLLQNVAIIIFWFQLYQFSSDLCRDCKFRISLHDGD